MRWLAWGVAAGHVGQAGAAFVWRWHLTKRMRPEVDAAQRSEAVRAVSLQSIEANREQALGDASGLRALARIVPMAMEMYNSSGPASRWRNAGSFRRFGQTLKRGPLASRQAAPERRTAGSLIDHPLACELARCAEASHES